MFLFHDNSITVTRTLMSSESKQFCRLDEILFLRLSIDFSTFQKKLDQIKIGSIHSYKIASGPNLFHPVPNQQAPLKLAKLVKDICVDAESVKIVLPPFQDFEHVFQGLFWLVQH